MRTLVKGIPRDGNMKFRVVKPRVGRHHRRRAKTQTGTGSENEERTKREKKRERENYAFAIWTTRGESETGEARGGGQENRYGGREEARRNERGRQGGIAKREREMRSSLGSPSAAHNYSGPGTVGETPLTRTWWLAGEWDHGAALSRPVSFPTTSVSQSRGLGSIPPNPPNRAVSDEDAGAAVEADF